MRNQRQSRSTHLSASCPSGVFAKALSTAIPRQCSLPFQPSQKPSRSRLRRSTSPGAYRIDSVSEGASTCRAGPSTPSSGHCRKTRAKGGVGMGTDSSGTDTAHKERCAPTEFAAGDGPRAGPSTDPLTERGTHRTVPEVFELSESPPNILFLLVNWRRGRDSNFRCLSVFQQVTKVPCPDRVNQSAFIASSSRRGPVRCCIRPRLRAAEHLTIFLYV